MLMERCVFQQRLRRKFSRLHNLRQGRTRILPKVEAFVRNFVTLPRNNIKTFLHEEIYSRHPDGHHNALIVL